MDRRLARRTACEPYTLDLMDRRLARRTACEPYTLDLMDRRLARRNLRTALITAVIGLLMFALTFLAALFYVA